MKKNLTQLVLVIGMLMAGFNLSSQDCGYYPIKPGTIIGYQSLDGKGKSTGTSRVTIVDVIQGDSKAIYKVNAENWDEKDKSLGTRDYTMKCENGEFSIDMKSLIDPKSMENFKDMEITFSGTDMAYPSHMSVGQVLPDADITMGAATGGLTLMNLTIKITNRKVEAIESVTVPAGTYECYKITYDIETKMGIKMSNVAIQWMNKGVGNVKSETYDKKGKLLGTTVLKEFKS